MDTIQVNLDSNEPLGVIAQDPLDAQHVPCINCISIGPITRPCIGTVLCYPGTTSDHLVTSGEDECTSRWQMTRKDGTDDLEQEAGMPPVSGGGLMMEESRKPQKHL